VTITRIRAREILSTHLLGTEDLVCQRCGRAYGAIIEGEIECDVEAAPGETGPGRIRSWGTWGSRRGYVDPNRPGLAWIRAVCEPELRALLVAEAERQRITLSEIVRRACRVYVGLGDE
jgi:hypothetical protein